MPVLSGKPLDEVQRKSLCLYLDAYETSGREALEVELGIIPLHIRRQELSIREVAKMIRKTGKMKLRVRSSYLHLESNNFS